VRLATEAHWTSLPRSLPIQKPTQSDLSFNPPSHRVRFFEPHHLRVTMTFTESLRMSALRQPLKL
jgi:hypothetical protein